MFINFNMNAENSIVNYFIFKNMENRGFVRYGYFKRLITYILDLHHKEYYVRKLFLKLNRKGYFIKKETERKSFLYKFNPNPNEEEEEEEINNKNESITLEFN